MASLVFIRKAFDIEILRHGITYNTVLKMEEKHLITIATLLW